MLLLLLQICIHSEAQQQAKLKYIYFDPMEKEGILLNTDIDISSFKYSDYLNFLPKLIESDQFYRKKLDKMIEQDNPGKYQEMIHRMERNDRADEFILLKLLKKFGWPCSKNPGDSFTAWIVVWHASTYERNDFYPYLKQALEKKCILKAHYDEFNIR